jgi:hypothetical protein
MATDLDAMPDPCSASAPYFSGQPNELLATFLQEFDALAASHRLTDGQKVRTILEYVPPTVRDFWKTLDGFGTGDWQTFRTTIEALYPSATTRYTMLDLEDFVDISALSRVKNEGDVMLYYRRFLQMSTPLYNSKQLTDYERNEEFFEEFHIKDRGILARRLYLLKPDHPLDMPWDFQDVLEAARLCFPFWHYPSLLQDQDRLRDDPDRLRSTDVSQEMERWFGREESDPRFHRQKPSQSEEDRKLEEIIKKLHGLSVHDPTYAVLYAQCKLRFPEVAQELVKPAMFQSAASAPVYQAPATQPRQKPPRRTTSRGNSHPRSPALGRGVPSPNTTSDMIASYFRDPH